MRGERLKQTIQGKLRFFFVVVLLRSFLATQRFRFFPDDLVANVSPHRAQDRVMASIEQRNPAGNAIP